MGKPAPPVLAEAPLEEDGLPLLLDGLDDELLLLDELEDELLELLDEDDELDDELLGGVGVDGLDGLLGLLALGQPVSSASVAAMAKPWVTLTAVVEVHVTLLFLSSPIVLDSTAG